MATKYSKFSVITVTIVNFAVIIGVTWWSGTLRERNIYDEHRIKLDSFVLLVENLEDSVDFYSRVLNFSPHKSGNKTNVAVFQFPDGQRVVLAKKQQNQLSQIAENFFARPQTIVLNLRNRFEEFHQAMVQRSGSSAQPLSSIGNSLLQTTPKQVSTIQTHDWGREFIVTDPDGNIFVFYTGATKKSRWMLE